MLSGDFNLRTGKHEDCIHDDSDNFFDYSVENPLVLKVARNSFLARAAWLADCACLREHTRLTQVQMAILYPPKFCKIYISIENISES